MGRPSGYDDDIAFPEALLSPAGDSLRSDFAIQTTCKIGERTACHKNSSSGGDVENICVPAVQFGYARNETPASDDLEGIVLFHGTASQESLSDSGVVD